MKTIEKHALSGEKQDVMTALSLLTRATVQECGKDKRRLETFFTATTAWQEKLAATDLPLSKKARKNSLIDFMPDILDIKIPDEIKRQDLATLSYEELEDCCLQIAENKDIDEPTIDALCWGILDFTSHKNNEGKIIQTKTRSGLCLEGYLNERNCGATWVTLSTPFFDVDAIKSEYLVNPEGLLIEAFTECQRFISLENEIKTRYSVYQKKLATDKNKTSWKKYTLFMDIYGDIIDRTVILNPISLFEDFFDIKF